MSAVIVDIADHMVTALTAGSYAVSVTVSRGYVVPIDLSNISGVSLIVIPEIFATGAMDLRARQETSPQVDVWVLSRVISSSTANVDQLVLVLEQVAAILKPGTKLSGTRYQVTAVECPRVCDPVQLDTKQVFQSSLRFTYRFTQP